MIWGAVWLVLVARVGAGATPLADPETLVFFGDSISCPGDASYTVFVETWLRQQTPRRRLEVHNFSWPGESSGVAAARFSYDVAPVRPTTVLVAFGMNDGVVEGVRGRQSPAILAATRIAHRRLARLIHGVHARAIFLTPSCVDYRPPREREVSMEFEMDGKHYVTYGQEAEFADAGQLAEFPQYNGTLALIAEAIATAAARPPRAEVIDLFHALLPLQREMKQRSPALALIGDGIHPNPAGHLVMAYFVLKHLGVTPGVAEIELAGGRVTRRHGASVERLHRDRGTVAFSLRLDHLPLSIPPEAGPALELVPFQSELNRCRLSVRDWPAGHPLYLYSGGRLAGIFTSEEAGAGIDLALLPSAAWSLESRALQRAVVAQVLRRRAHWRGWVERHDRPPAAQPKLRTLALNPTIFLDAAGTAGRVTDGIRTGPFELTLHDHDPLTDAARRPFLLEGWEGRAADLWRPAYGRPELVATPRVQREGRQALRVQLAAPVVGPQGIATAFTPPIDLSACRTLALDVGPGESGANSATPPRLALTLWSAEGLLGEIKGRRPATPSRGGWQPCVFTVAEAVWTNPRTLQQVPGGGALRAIKELRLGWTRSATDPTAFVLDNLRVLD